MTIRLYFEYILYLFLKAGSCRVFRLPEIHPQRLFFGEDEFDFSLCRGDGRGMVAAFALGAEGVQLGKALIVAAGDRPS